MNTTCLVPARQEHERHTPRLRVDGPLGSSHRNRPFQARFCDFLQCSSEDYEGQLFKRSLHQHARPIAGLLRRLNPDFFQEDVALIRDLANAHSHGEVLTELNRFYGRNVRDRNWLRKTLSLRISGKRILRLSRTLFRRQKREER